MVTQQARFHRLLSLMSRCSQDSDCQDGNAQSHASSHTILLFSSLLFSSHNVLYVRSVNARSPRPPHSHSLSALPREKVYSLRTRLPLHLSKLRIQLFCRLKHSMRLVQLTVVGAKFERSWRKRRIYW